MAWVEVLQWDPLGALTEAARRLHETIVPAASPVPAVVPVCRCAGVCRCSTLVPYLLQRQIEMECEFYRDVH